MGSKKKHVHHGKKYYRNKGIISFLLSFITAMAFAVMLLVIIINTGICNPDVLKNSINETTYYDELYEKVSDDLAERLAGAGIPDTVMEGVIDERRITLDVGSYINQVLEQNGQVDIDTSEFEEKLTANLESYFAEKNVETVPELTKRVGEFVKAAAVSYSSSMRFEYVKYFNGYVVRYKSLGKYIIPICVVMIMLSFVMLMIMHRKKYRGVRYINYGLLSGSLLAIIVNVMFKKAVLAGIPDGSEAYYSAIRGYISGSFSQGMYICCAGMMVFLVIVMLTIYLRNCGI